MLGLGDAMGVSNLSMRRPGVRSQSGKWHFLPRQEQTAKLSLGDGLGVTGALSPRTSGKSPVPVPSSPEHDQVVLSVCVLFTCY